MIGAVPFTYGGKRLFSYTKHGTELSKLADFARAIQQEFTVASVPFCEIRDRENLAGVSGLSDGYGLYSKAIITFRVGGERFGFPIYAPRSDILEPVNLRGKSQMRVLKEIGERFAEIYPADQVEYEAGWLCR